MQRIVIAVDSFKGTMDSIEVCDLIESSFNRVLPEVDTIKIPIADGGEGTVDSFLAALGGEKINVKVQDPLGREIEAFYGVLSDQKTAIIEVAAASGLPLVEGEENPLLTSTYGTGQLILAALDRGCENLIIGLGGSATTDGGIGMAAAWGIKFLGRNNKPIPLNGQGLGELRRIDAGGKDKRLDQCQILVASDVDNPLYGKKGAAYVFAPQKGADFEMVARLDRNLRNYSAVLHRDLGVSVANHPGSGAAGGLGAAFLAFSPAELKPGIDIILDSVRFDQLIAGADLIITGEGKLDGQSVHGKVPFGVAQRAKKKGIPVIAIVGDVGEGAEKIYAHGIDAIFSINRVAIPFSEAKKRSKEDLAAASSDLARLLKIASQVHRP